MQDRNFVKRIIMMKKIGRTQAERLLIFSSLIAGIIVALMLIFNFDEVENGLSASLVVGLIFLNAIVLGLYRTKLSVFKYLVRLPLSRRRAEKQTIDFYLTAVYGKHLRGKVNPQIAILIAVAGVAYILSNIAQNIGAHWLSWATVLAASALQLHAILIEYRIRLGLFGTNASEAIDLLEFFYRHADDIDMSDGGSGGGRREIFAPEAKVEAGAAWGQSPSGASS
jgi:hypothetical protein